MCFFFGVFRSQILSIPETNSRESTQKSLIADAGFLDLGLISIADADVSPGGVKKVDSSFLRFPLFYSGGSPNTQKLEKLQEKCHCHTPSCVPPNASKN